MNKRNKLNQLLSSWPDGQIHSTKWLNQKGYKSTHLQKYKNGQWIESVGKGAYKKSGDSVSWTSGLICLQQELKLQTHLGGKSALEVQGKAQYIPFHQRGLTLIGRKKNLLPLWFKKAEWGLSIDYRVKNLFKKDEFEAKPSGYTTQESGGSVLILSAPERAYLEYLDELPQRSSYSEAEELLENLPSLRVGVLQSLLENCTSHKVKRLFLHFADKVRHPWFDKIDVSKIELGAGKRVVFKNGIFDSKYRITVPRGTESAETSI